MSLGKKLFGYFLILFSLFTIILIGFPQIYSSNDSGRINKELDLSINFLKNEDKDIVLLYFGYVGCSTICLTSMSEISSIYKQLDKKKIQVYFINLLDTIKDETLPHLFASTVNKNFKGIYLEKKELLKVTNQLNVIFSKSITDKYELNHAGHLYVLQKDTFNKTYKQKFIYTTRPYKKESIVKDIKKLINQRT